jgi:hypothetical protein
MKAEHERKYEWMNSSNVVFPPKPIKDSNKLFELNQFLNRQSIEIDFYEAEALKKDTLKNKVKLFMRSLFCTRRLPEKVEPDTLPSDEYKFFTPGRSSSHETDITFCTHFCEQFNELAKSLQLDGYYAPKISKTSGVDRGLHEEVMLCKPYDKIKLKHKIGIGKKTISPTVTGTVKNSLGVKKEVAARERIKEIATRDRLFRKRKLSLELPSDKKLKR